VQRAGDEGLRFRGLRRSFNEWAVENGTNGVLHAYDATNLATELYNSTQAANDRDTFPANKYMTPMVTNRKVYVGTPNSVVVFGLLR
jgi:hypothetical protein